MQKTQHRSMGRWFLAAGLLLFGLFLSGFSCPGNIPDHLPARAEARAASAQQSLRRQSVRAEIKVEQAKAAPMLAMLLSLVPARPHAPSDAVVVVATTSDSSLWLMPYMFRPPPANILVR
ncbi:hypothetical protein [Terriglobus roseus]|uniref:Uncharacterized protein n=1 Tax=Terriglobus roseus TaxID=392734 RepID=A0A1H4T8S1_9BACT|nr:hypothetical protein [Terriglobus roseus]SEC52832.1 hypothetical protein SAMN05443244_3680 [Terriglobus roseus]